MANNCDISFSSRYEKECPKSNECIWWSKEGCKLKLRDEK